MKAPFYFKLGNWLLSCSRVCLSVLPVNFVRALFCAAIRGQDWLGKDFMSAHFRSKCAAEFSAGPAGPIAGGRPEIRPGIVIQGPLFKTDNFTLESIALYRKVWPGVPAILSTWEDEDADVLKRCEDLGAHVLRNKKPPNPGVVNVNYQAVSSSAGMQFARQLGCTHAIKIRSDVRICSPQALSLLADLSETFPLHRPGMQKERLIGTSLYTAILVPYLVGDHFMYGHIDDMAVYWSPPLSPEPPPFDRESLKVREMTPETCPEIYLTVEYMKNRGRLADFTVANHWRELAEHFCIVNREMLDLYWPKYFPHAEFISSRRYEHMFGLYNLQFHDWLRLYVGFRDGMTTPEFVREWPAFSKPREYPPERLSSFLTES